MAKKSSKKRPNRSVKKNNKQAKLFSWLDNANKKYKLEKKLPLISVLILISTTVYWTVLGFIIQRNNADQLVNPYLFDSVDVAKNALYPPAHTFLLKWPLFALIRLFHYSQPAYLAITLLVVLITVAGFVYLIYRIEKRPLYFASICLALSSVLLMIPANPYAGGLLPVNMAMIATRNLEYLLFILGLVLLMKANKIKNKYFVYSFLVFGLLFASDRLYLIISASGSIIALAVFSIFRYWRLVTLVSFWLLSTFVAALLSILILYLINSFGLANISGSSAGGPYGLVKTGKDLLLGIFYAFSSLLTNMGANPVFDGTTIKSIPEIFNNRALSAITFPTIVNLAIFGAGLGALWIGFIKPLFKNKRSNASISPAFKLVYLMTSSMVAAIIIFVLTDHYYAVDSRYLALIFFTLFLAITSVLSRQKLAPHKLLLADILITLSIIIGLFASFSVFKSQNTAYDDVSERNIIISKVLKSKPVDTLVGDYWRVIPIKNVAKQKFNVSPYASCTQPRNSLTSKAWYPDLNKHSFAYLLTFDKSLSDFPNCSLNEITKAFGRPNSSIIIAGTLDNPKELLLYFDHGAHKNTVKHTPSQQASTIFPINPDELTGAVCNVPTVMNVVAHQDDDLLFINPDISNDIDNGNCVRTVFVTAGDAGYANYYWLGRQRGSEAAYSKMIGSKQDIWIEKTVKFADKQFVTVAQPKGNQKVALIFIHLPDGNLNGEGFTANKQQSLSKLLENKEQYIGTVDGQSNYNKQDIVELLYRIMQIYQPTELRTQSIVRGNEYPDHGDHNAVGVFASEAFNKFQDQRFEGKVKLPLTYYIGYPIHALPNNLTTEQISKKADIFLTYAKYDGSVCRNFDKCLQHTNYGIYIDRQYKSSNY